MPPVNCAGHCHLVTTSLVTVTPRLDTIQNSHCCCKICIHGLCILQLEIQTQVKPDPEHSGVSA